MSGVSFSMDQDRLAVVAELWKTHCDAAFPSRLRSTDVAGVEMVVLDADVAGCISTWLTNGGGIDSRRREILMNRERLLARVVPKLSGPEVTYFQRLLDMTALVLDSRDELPSS
jgi:hypothetical protein